MKIKKGRLWLGLDWETAIKKTFLVMDNRFKRGYTCGFIRIERIFKDKNPNKLFCDEKEFKGFRFICDEDRRTLKTTIPKKYNSLIEKEFIKMEMKTYKVDEEFIKMLLNRGYLFESKKGIFRGLDEGFDREVIIED